MFRNIVDAKMPPLWSKQLSCMALHLQATNSLMMILLQKKYKHVLIRSDGSVLSGEIR
jgi:hypothetical protein